jgi:quercetin dioxygenase-like cupin family protein
MRRPLTLALFLSTCAGGVAVRATMGHGVDATLIGARSSAARGDVTVRRITIAPGGSTGWHYHDGELIAAVASGTLTRTLADCSTVQTSAGASFVEPAGRGHVHIGRNLGTEPVVLYVTYLLPPGSPLARAITAPDCGD